MRIQEMTAKEFAEAIKKEPIVFLPIGATEAHGIHLPLGTDCYQPEALCAELAERFDGFLAPTISYGVHSSTRNMPGTIGVESETLKAVVTDVLLSMHRSGVRNAVVITGHAGSIHMAAAKDAIGEVVRVTGMRIMFLSDYDIAYRFPIEADPEHPDGHGGLVETSRVLAIRPDLVRSKRRKGEFRDPRFMILADPERCFPQGMVGDPTKATPKLGQEINQFIFDRMCELIGENFKG
jgi:creatinine amidohydrolase